ncbi:MAG: tRNA (adenosine(37)-N6)-threonylcarbamoyltransferase complex transferase subunit TsaD [Bacteroidales bacterium]|jgi:N6-L-threonylcarbamoyladenine synthase|nr:tRNA (adenosine(37)-N6)-threonylcarbamoyltransferase complex transferase subunit TsaD [Bacteroidales bacterium]
MSKIILGIETSCDDTSAAVLRGEDVMSNVIASQAVHEKYGGVVPELASRAHEQNIIPVVDAALKDAGVKVEDLDAIAYTRGPGLLGSLLVGSSFVKGLSLASNLPMIEINHLHGHIFAHFLRDADNRDEPRPRFPFLNLLVSGGHTQIIIVKDYMDFEILGGTIDDAAGEAFDKCAKVMGLGYPGGPVIDKLAKSGNIDAFTFAKPRIAGLDFSFSGLKTSFLYLIRDHLKANPHFIEQEKENLSASIQSSIVEILKDKLVKASRETGIKEVAASGGVSANSHLKAVLTETAKHENWTLHIPRLKYTTDNAAMIALIGYYKFLKGEFATHELTPVARMKVIQK